MGTGAGWRGVTARGFRFAAVGLLAAALCFAGCSPEYVVRAAYEEAKILWRRRPIETLLEQNGLDAEARKKLEMVLAVRAFARDELRLEVDGSYNTYSYVDRAVLSYLLTAVPQTELEPYTWWFLFLGSVPYKGFFDEEDASTEAATLEAQGYDTNLRPVAAFSTLGWFDDPLLASLLHLDDVSLADVIVHELLHNTFFLSGAVDFNESFANFVGKRGAIEFFEKQYGFGSREAQWARRTWQEELEFSVLIQALVTCLTRLYETDRARSDKLRLRSEIFAGAQAEWRRQTEGRPEHRHRDFSNRALNNAVILQQFLYLRNLLLFEQLYQQRGKDLDSVIALVRESTETAEEPFDSLKALAGTHGAPAAVGSYGFCSAL